MNFIKVMFSITGGFNLVFLTIGLMVLRNNEPWDVTVVCLNLVGFIASVLLVESQD
jgi:hypothetical protein